MVVAVLAASALIAAGCGGEERSSQTDEETTRPSTAGTGSRYMERLREICTHLTALGGDALDRTVTERAEAVRALRRLAPPTELAEAHDRFATAHERSLGLARRLVRDANAAGWQGEPLPREQLEVVRRAVEANLAARRAGDDLDPACGASP
jgi:hypothetical protein